MRTRWVWASVLVLCASPALAQTRERARERGDRGGDRSSGNRHADRGQRPSETARRESGTRGERRWEQSGRPSEAPQQRSDWRGQRGQTDRGAGREWRSDRRSSSRDSRYSDRGRDTRDDRGYSGRDRRAGDRRSYQPYGRAPRDNRSYRSFLNRSRYPSYYRHGYYLSHGYYYPRYYYDYDSYPTHASVRVLVDPSAAEVYVDGYYAGTADDFDGIFQRLHIAPGDHEITLQLNGYQTWSADIDAAPGSTVMLRHDMVPGVSEGVTEDYRGEPTGPESLERENDQ